MLSQTRHRVVAPNRKQVVPCRFEKDFSNNRTYGSPPGEGKESVRNTGPSNRGTK